MKNYLKSVEERIRFRLRPALRKAYYGSIDLAESALGLRDELTPPRSMIFVGIGGYKRIGAEFLEHFRTLGGLEPDHRVLDVGCGIGRMAGPLTGYLSAEGEYRGFDIVPQGIEWCREHITPKFPNFHFAVSDVFNGRYYPAGTHRAEDYVFPYDEAYFDLVTLTSVFTHMIRPELTNYLAQIARVLKPGGRTLITFFLLNPESRRLIETDKSDLDFRHDHDGCLVIDPRIPESAIAYDEDEIRALHDECGLDVIEPLHYGSWSGREPFLSYQDIMVAQKR